MGKVNVVGLGYIGLPTALMLQTHGVEVFGTDYNSELVETLKSGKMTFKEEGMDEVFAEAMDRGIEFSTEYIKTDRYLIAVPTPYDKSTKKIDPTFLVNAVKTVVDICEPDSLIIVESTIPPGTIDHEVRPVIDAKKKEAGYDIHIVHAPERIIPGSMVRELQMNDRTIGADDEAQGLLAKELYGSFCRGEIVITDIRTAEMSKVVENTYRDINIAFANELARICRHDGMDVYKIIDIANRHPRVNILQPGPGVGGHCISVDPWFLIGEYPNLTPLIRASREGNDSMPAFVLERISEVMKEQGLTDFSRVGLYGLTYKEDVDDTRESPTLQLLEEMEKQGVGGVKIYDPMVKKTMVDHQYQDFDAFLKDVDFVVILVGHEHLKKNMDRLTGKILLDTKNISSLPGTHKL